MIRLGELHIATTELSFIEYPVQIWHESRQFKSLAVSVVVVSKNQNWLIYYFDKAGLRSFTVFSPKRKIN